MIALATLIPISLSANVFWPNPAGGRVDCPDSAGMGVVVMEGDAEELRTNEDVKEFYLGLSSGERKSFKDVKHYRRRKRWLS